MANTMIYEFNDYKKYIHQWLKSTPNEGRGLRKAMADAIGCQTPFITHVLSGEYHFSPEQGEACGRWLGLNEMEKEYFVFLVQRARAGTKELEDFYGRQITKIKHQSTVLKKRLRIDSGIPPEKRVEYYSSWLYGAIHMAIMIPELQSTEALVKYFNLTRARVLTVLNFLDELQMITKKNGRWTQLMPSLHLEEESPLNLQHQCNWRLRAIESIQQKKPENLHYSAIISTSQEDFEWVREKLAQTLEQLVDRVKKSKDEKLASVCIDWYQV